MKHQGGTSDFRRPTNGKNFTKALSRLESAIHEVISTGWAEPPRRHAYEISSALHDAARDAGWKERSGILQKLTALLALSLREILSTREAVRDKMLELLGLLLSSVRSQIA
ncbi:MAG: hypothetical protein JO332_20120 [Planctomycetaceae bacterium]|nr:hypothetical protein [Planctomycetaceae bacterium]